MKDGKKTIAEKLVYKALEKIKEDSKQEPLGVFEKAIANVAPKMEVKPRRVGGASYQVPIEVRGERKEALAIRWILEGARSRSNSAFHGFDLKLAAELMDAANSTGTAMKKKEDIQKSANANRAFSHFRW
jgi:small subunit ribosomal protein S7